MSDIPHDFHIETVDRRSVAALTNFLERWKSETRGRPLYDQSLRAIETLVQLERTGRCSASPYTSFSDIGVFIPSHNVDDVIEYATRDRLKSAQNSDPSRRPVDGWCRKTAPLPSATVEVSMIVGICRDLSSDDYWVALGDFQGSSRNMGSIQFRIPDVFKPFVTRESDEVCPNNDIELGGTFTPVGWTSDAHFDYCGGLTVITHLFGYKLWFVFPRTPHNAKIMDGMILGDHDPDDFLANLMPRVEGLQWFIMTKPAAFILDPFEYHGCFSLEPSMHIGGPVWMSQGIEDSVSQVHSMITTMESGIVSDTIKNVRKQKMEIADHVRNSYTESIYRMTTVAKEIVDPVERIRVEEALQKLQDRIVGLEMSGNASDSS